VEEEKVITKSNSGFICDLFKVFSNSPFKNFSFFLNVKNKLLKFFIFKLFFKL